jgi:hypothetical protein
MPGKKPAKIAPAGNALQSAWAVGVADVVVPIGTTVTVDVPAMEVLCDGALTTQAELEHE